MFYFSTGVTHYEMCWNSMKHVNFRYVFNIVLVVYNFIKNKISGVANELDIDRKNVQGCNEFLLRVEIFHDLIPFHVDPLITF